MAQGQSSEVRDAEKVNPIGGESDLKDVVTQVKGDNGLEELSFNGAQGHILEWWIP